MKKVILVDSNSLLYRSYYALPNLSTKDGFPTGGIYGFLRIVSKLLTEAHSHFIIVGDAKGVLARSLVFKEFLMESDIMLLDEPFGALDAITRINMQEWLLKVLVEHKKTVLFITHDIEEAIFLSDRVYVLSGRPAML